MSSVAWWYVGRRDIVGSGRWQGKRHRSGAQGAVFPGFHFGWKICEGLGRRWPIQVFDKDGKFIENWAAPCRGNIVIMKDDTLYASDVNAGAVTILKDGKILDVIHVEGRPHGLSVDPTTLDVYTSSTVAQNPNVTKSVRKKAASN